MIESKHINAIIAVAVIIALIAALLIVGFSNNQVVEAGRVQPYESALFGGDIITLEIIADPDEWDNMIKNAMQEEYIMVDVVVNGTKFQSVGIRPKGNSSLAQVASTSSPERYSFRLKFDEYVKGQTCFGLDTFVVNNMLGDSSYMKEYLSFDLMRSIGVDTPLFDFADISVNGEKWGLYLAIEAYDDSYMTRVFGDASGNLYNVKSMDMGGWNEDNGSGMPWMPGNDQVPQRPGGGQFPGMPGNWQMPAMPSDGQFPGMPGNGQMPAMPGGGQMSARPGNGQRQDQSATEPSPNTSRNGRMSESPADANSSATLDIGQMLEIPSDGQFPAFPRGDENSNVDGRGRGMFGGMFGGMGRGGGDLKYTDDNVSSYSSIFNNVVGKVTEQSQKNVIEALKNLSEGSNLETYFDVDQILRYMAAHTIVVNLDSYSSNMAQNYYIYEKDGRLTVLPWDYNYAFGGFQSGDASSVVNFPIDTPVSGVSLEDRPLFAQLLANETYKARYHEYLKTLMTEYFTEGKWAAKIEKLNSLISDYVEKDPSKFCTFEEYQKAVAALTTLGELRAESIMGQLNGTIPSTTEGQRQNPDKLVSTETLNMRDLNGNRMGGGRGAWDWQNNEDGETCQWDLPAGGFGPRGQFFSRNRGQTQNENGALNESARPGVAFENNISTPRSSTANNNALILMVGSVILLIGAIVFAAKYKKRY